MHSPWREMTPSQWDAAATAYRTEPQPPPAPVEPPADDEVPDEPLEEPATPEEGELP